MPPNAMTRKFLKDQKSEIMTTNEKLLKARMYNK